MISTRFNTGPPSFKIECKITRDFAAQCSMFNFKSWHQINTTLRNKAYRTWCQLILQLTVECLGGCLKLFYLIPWPHSNDPITMTPFTDSPKDVNLLAKTHPYKGIIYTILHCIFNDLQIRVLVIFNPRAKTAWSGMPMSQRLGWRVMVLRCDICSWRLPYNANIVYFCVHF